MQLPDILRRHLTREVTTFLAVGGAGHSADVIVFNVLRSIRPWSTLDPAVARTAAVAIAMCVTYLGNRTVTWQNQATSDRTREIGLFIVVNLIGFGLSVMTLMTSHDVMGLTSRLADNISANGVGLTLGTVFRFIAYKHLVFRGADTWGSEAPPGDRPTRLGTLSPPRPESVFTSRPSQTAARVMFRRAELYAGVPVAVALRGRVIRRVGTSAEHTEETEVPG